MERRRAATVAGAAAVTAVAAVLGLGATFGLFEMTEASSRGGSDDPAPVTVASVADGGRASAPPAVTSSWRDD